MTSNRMGNRMINKLSGLFLSLFLAFSASAAEEQAAAPVDPETAGLYAAFTRLVPGVSPDSVRPSPLPGLYEVVFGANVVYMSGDGRYLMQGVLLDVDTMTDLTEPRRAEGRLRLIDDVGEENMIIFGPELAKHTVTVFTDIDCPYCRKLHMEVPKMNELGIRVRYLLTPRSQVGSPSYKKAVAVWCAADRAKALTDAKNGVEVPEKDCPNPVARHMMVGEMAGMRGTPAIVTDDGTLIPGYMTAERLMKMLVPEAPAPAPAAQAEPAAEADKAAVQ